MPSSFLDRFRDPQAPDDKADDGIEAISVSELNQRARLMLERGFGSCWIEGEISSLSQPSSGHAYFTLKDEQAQVRCALFRQRARFVSSPLREGQQVQVRAQVSLFEPRGDYQLIVESVRDAGKGAWLAALEKLKTRLAEEGVFANTRALPYPPKHLAVISSPTGAAIRDVLSVLRARWPWVKVHLLPVQVQGEQAAGQIVAALGLANRDQRFDAILLTRGGGSLEDLWCFNDERVARAIFASRLPVVSAVGHEVDTTLADFAADLRAPTPSAAAERLVPDQRDIRRRLVQLANQLLRANRARLDTLHQRVDYLSARLRHPGERLREQRGRLEALEGRMQRAQSRRLAEERSRLERLAARLGRQPPSRRLTEQRQRLGMLETRLERAGSKTLERVQQRFDTLIQRLDVASPLATLRRGYAVLEDDQHRVIRRADEVGPGQRLTARLSEGRLALEVKRRLKE
ncbi:exodeoxyribonuclease VII large subunit [Halotalea alkalilenta]|uniref:exodeoxyribonuclease VII large subunit n=1 Tax=Halotalea alkalilenta TaxID=376489 RepID=UPI0009DE31B0|nr:exodeoxyribonuclease VII large subunit [Halotalea alkalilenta]